jgi:hypothetical protein
VCVCVCVCVCMDHTWGLSGADGRFAPPPPFVCVKIQHLTTSSIMFVVRQVDEKKYLRYKKNPTEKSPLYSDYVYIYSSYIVLTKNVFSTVTMCMYTVTV